jgi:hypothetical protein
MNRCALLAGLLSALAIPTEVRAIADVMVGNEPIGPGLGFGKELLATVNIEERVCFVSHIAYQSFYFKGGPKAVNDTLRRFATLPAKRREIRLLPIPAKPLGFDKPIPYDWQLHLTATSTGRGPRADRKWDASDCEATLTVYIPEPLPAPLADPAAARKWIADLDRDDFKARDRAARELAALGTPVARELRAALKGKPSAEARDRMEKLLAGLSTDLRLDVLDLPAGVRVVSLDSLLAQARKELANKDPNVRGNAAWDLTSHGAPAEEILPDLEKMLKSETAVSPLIGAARAAYQLGAPARPLLPTLRETAKSADKNVADMCKVAIEAIEKATADAVPEKEAKRRATIRKEIREFVAGLEKAAPK